jgi:hypothetical protein
MDQWTLAKYPIEHPYKTVAGVAVKGLIFGAAVGLFKVATSNDNDNCDAIYHNHHRKDGMLYNQLTPQTTKPSAGHIIFHHILKDTLISLALGVSTVLAMKYFANHIYEMMSPSLQEYRDAKSLSEADKIFQKMDPREKELTVAAEMKKASAQEFELALHAMFTFNNGVLTDGMKKTIFDNAKNRLSGSEADLDKFDVAKHHKAFQSSGDAEQLAGLRIVAEGLATAHGKLTSETDKANLRFLLNAMFERLYYPHVSDETRETIKHDVDAHGMGMIK